MSTVGTSYAIAWLNEAVLRENGNTRFCKLCHPRTEEAALYLLSQQDTHIEEVLRFDEDCRSWFMDESVIKDGSFLLTTPVNPLFLVLPYLIKASKSGHYQPLDQLLTDSDHPDVRRLITCLRHETLLLVADHKGEDLKAYRYCESSTLTWLKTKVEKLSKKLKEKSVNIAGDKYAAAVIQEHTDEEYTRFAHGMISDYLFVSLAEQLREHMGIKVVVHEKPAAEDEPPKKKARKGDVKPLEDYSANMKDGGSKKAENLTAAQKKLGKVDKKGMKNIASFFSPKPAKAKK